MKTGFRLLAFLSGLLTAGVAFAQPEGFELTDAKVPMKVWEAHPDARQVAMGHLVTARIRYRTDADSVLSDWRKLNFAVQKPRYKGHVMAAYPLLHEGDSATMAVPANTFFPRELGQNRPGDISGKTWILLDVKVIQSRTAEEVQQGSAEEQANIRKQNDFQIRKYLAKKGLKAEPDSLGLYRVTLQEGSGLSVGPESSIKVHYIGKLLNDTEFDSSIRKGEPFPILMGKGQVIKGWERGLVGTKVGGKYLLLVPAHLAYGRVGVPGSIVGPHAPLAFEVEVLRLR